MAKEQTYKFSTITLAGILLVTAIFYFISRSKLNDSSMEAQLMWFSLTSQSDHLDSYKLVCEQYGEVITEDDFSRFQDFAENGMMKYPVLLCRDVENNSIALVQFSKNPEDGSYQIIHVQILSDSLASELFDVLAD